MPKPAALIYNPRSGRQQAGRVLPELDKILGGAGYQLEHRPTQGPGDAIRLAREAAAEGRFEVVFALGGDGTLREVATGLVGSQVALGCLPAGTVNVLALELGIPRSALAAARALTHAVPRPMDVGLAGEHLFLMMASGGIDAVVMAQQNAGLKRLLGTTAIGITGIGSFLAYDYPEIEVEIAGAKHAVSFFSVCNIPYYGGKLQMAPGADRQDGQLDVVLFHGSGRLATAAFALALARGRHLERPDTQLVRCSEMVIQGPLPAGLQVDGDILQVELPLSIRIRRHQLQILSPMA